MTSYGTQFSLLNNYKTTQGPQKKFAGPHAARGPHFGLVWVITLKLSMNTVKAA